MVRHQLYSCGAKPKSSTSPSMRALPMFPRSRKLSRYSRASIGIKRKSIFRKIFFSSRCAKDSRVKPGAIANASISCF